MFYEDKHYIFDIDYKEIEKNDVPLRHWLFSHKLFWLKAVRYKDDIYFYAGKEFMSENIYKLEMEKEIPTLSILYPESNLKPKNRIGFSINIFHDKILIVAGTCNERYSYLQDVWAFDINTKSWIEIPNDFPFLARYG